MPRGKKRSLVEDREWLRAYEEGKTLEQMAREAGRASSTVWKGIQQARQEREARVVRETLLREAYQRHYEDLLGVARQVQEAARTPNSNGLLPIMDRRTKMLVDGLKEHILNSPLWRAWRDWENLARQLLADVAPKLKSRLGDMVDSALAPWASYANREGFVESLWFGVKTIAEGASLKGMEYGLEERGGPTLCWGQLSLSKPLPDVSQHSDSLKEQHERLLREVTAQEWVSEIRDVWGRWEKARDSIQEEVEVLLLRHHVPGRCNLCPQ